MSKSAHSLPQKVRTWLRSPFAKFTAKATVFSVLAVYFLFTLLIIFARWCVLPNINSHKEDIAAAIGSRIGCEVSIGSVGHTWEGIWPSVELHGVSLSNPQSFDDALVIPSVRVVVNWSSLLGDLSMRHIVVDGANIAVARTAEKIFEIGGIRIDLSKKKNPESTAQDAPKKKSGDGRENRERLIAALTNQDRIDILNTTVTYVDYTMPVASRTTFGNLNFSYRKNVVDYSLGMQAVLEDADSDSNHVDVRAELRHDLFAPRGDWDSWSGRVYLRADDLNLAKTFGSSFMSRVIRHGHGSTEAWANFANGRLESVTADVALSSLEMRLADKLRPLQVSDFRTRLTQRLENGVHHFAAEELTCKTDTGIDIGPIKIAADVKLAPDKTSTETVRITSSYGDLDLLREFSASLPLPDPLDDLMHDFAPSGKLGTSVISWSGPHTAPTDWQVSTSFSHLGIKPVGSVPGFSNISGKAEIDNRSGSVTLETKDATLSFPKVFPNPDIHLSVLTGKTSWNIDDKAPFKIAFDSVRVANSDVDTTVSGSWTATGGAGTLDLSGDIERVSAPAAWKYLPSIIHKGTRDWLMGGLTRGSAVDGKLVIRGKLSDYPWTRPGTDGLFFIEGNLVDAGVDYLPGLQKDSDGKFITGSTWPELTGIQGKLTFKGDSMTVRADRAVTFGAEVFDTTAVIPDLGAGYDTKLVIDGNARGALGGFFNYLEHSPIGGFTGHFFKKTVADGQANLRLHLDIPLVHARDTTVDGHVELAGNNVDMGWPVPPLEDAHGKVGFTHRGAYGKDITAKAFGLPVTTGISTSSNGTISISSTGEFSPRTIGFFEDNRILGMVLNRVEGTAPFVSNVSIARNGEVTVTAQSSLKGMSTSLAAPLAKRRDDVWPTEFSFTPTRHLGEKGWVISTEIGNAFDMIMQLPAGDSAMPPLATFAIGRKARLPRHGMALEIKADKAVWEDWQDDIVSLVEAAKSASKTASGQQGDAAGTSGKREVPRLERISVDVDSLQALDMAFNRVYAHATSPDDGSWRTRITTDGINGLVNYDPDADMLEANFSSLHLPEKLGLRVKDAISEIIESQPYESTVRAIPSIRAKVNDLSYGDKKIGNVTLEADAGRNAGGATWEITNAVIDNEHAKLFATGNWQQGSQGGQTTLAGQMHLTDGGKLLADFGFPGVVSGTSGSVTADISWLDAPWKPDFASLMGSTEINLKSGSLIQADTGAGGTVLSLISFQSLLKRLTLDFSDLTSDGFPFDSIEGRSSIVSGLSSTENTKIVGPHASILISGTTDFKTDKLDYNILVLPDVNAGGASLAFALVNPTIGLGSFLAQMVLSNPLSRLFSVEYKVSGTLENPVVTK